MTITVPFLDLAPAYEELKEQLDAAVLRVMRSGWYILGPEVEAFEEEFAAFCEAKHAVGVGTGLDALVLALRAGGIGPGDEVIVPSNTFIATWLAITAVGATIVPVEPDEQTYNITAEGIAQAITPRTKAVIVVHLYGQPADMDSILPAAKNHGLFLVEDAAQAHGARCRGKRIGSHGDVVCWSFYPTKNLGAAGDGGAITTNNAKLADRVRVLRNYGSHIKYHNEVIGTNSRLDPMQAAVLRTKLPYLDEWNERRRQIAKMYLTQLQGQAFTLPHAPEWAEPVWHLFVIRTQHRDALQQHLQKEGIATQIHYPIAPAQQEAYKDHIFPALPISTKMAEEVLSLPMGPHLTGNDIHKIDSSFMTEAL